MPFIRFCLKKFTTLRYKAVNMGTFYIITVFLPISQKFLKILKKWFGDFFWQKRNWKILLYTRLKEIVSTKHD